ncbi:DEAD/DEAH box helicase family protein [Salinicoccus jeotgali]|uniref:DEAD/DEAH box helicase family protein n=1 Tax=Salinicoccus jeotgali TaxID=381634 RepID=A0ABP7FBZ4_9STAP
MILERTGTIPYKKEGVDITIPKCHRCGNERRQYFYTYRSPLHEKLVSYCLKCANLGRADTMAPLYCSTPPDCFDSAGYILDFKLTKQQAYASDRIIGALERRQHLLLYAVTGAGKTEMTFAAISRARQNGMNVAFVSPRIDVVKEVYIRLEAAFSDSAISLMYDGVKQVRDHHFVVCTIHQLYNYIDHFDFVIVDETDAFPLPEDPLLMQSISRACRERASIIYMSATPSRQLIRQVGKENVVILPERFHGYKLAIPYMRYIDVRKSVHRNKVPAVCTKELERVLHDERKVMVFFPDIALMKKMHQLMLPEFPTIETVYSADPDRDGKVARMRAGETDILFTTTILERGVTFDRLDVIIIHAERFSKESLVQMCGRVGRKWTDPVGNICFMAAYRTSSITAAQKMLKSFNSGRVRI